jgi:C-terminal processing protease CtpA/Prc
MKLFNGIRIATLLALSATAGVLAGEAPAAPAAPAQSQAQTERALAEAQQRLEAAARDVSQLSEQLGRHMGEQRIVLNRVGPMRAQLGLQIDNTPAKDGAHVVAVSPGGPAAEAGIHDGDVITSIGGEDLTNSGDPGRELVEQVRQLEPDLKVKVTVLRSGKKMNFDVAPRPMPQIEMRRIQGMAPFAGPGPGPGPEMRGRIFTAPGTPPGQQLEWNSNGWLVPGESGMGFRGMEFANLSEKLGSYFGVKSGVLVVRTGNNDAFKLQDGDVILSIDGREPGNAQHAGRILRSYRGGEKLTLRVQRDRKAQNIEVTLPGGTDNDD